MLTQSDLTAYFAAGCKDPKQFSFGIEWEQFTYNKQTGKPLPYAGDISVLALLEKLIADYGWQPYTEKGFIIALKRKNAMGKTQVISLEPGGQIELSGALQPKVADVADEIDTYYKELTTACDALGIGLKSCGFTPDWTRADFHLMPKQRYDIMTQYMPTKGNLGLDMMFRTCTIQVNMDYASEADMIKKMRVAIALQPLSTALFANSAIKEGMNTGFKSYRSHVWTDTDPDRTGMLNFVFDNDFGFERYKDYMLTVPMYFVKRGDTYIDVAGCSFGDFMQGKLAALPSETPTLQDWEDHVSTAFPEVRLKQFLEMRGADSVAKERVIELAIFWDKFLYQTDILESVYNMVMGWDVQKISAMRDNVPKQGFETIAPDGRTLKQIYQAYF